MAEKTKYENECQCEDMHMADCDIMAEYGNGIPKRYVRGHAVSVKCGQISQEMPYST